MACWRYGLLLLIAFVFEVCAPVHAFANQAGAMRYNYVSKNMEFHDGTRWYNFGLGLALGACSREGAMEFDSLLAAYQVCNGTVWIKIVGIPTLSPCSKKGAMNFSGSTMLVCNGLLWTNIKGVPSV